MEPIWQPINDSPSTAFEPPDLGVDAATVEWKQQLRADAANTGCSLFAPKSVR